MYFDNRESAVYHQGAIALTAFSAVCVVYNLLSLVHVSDVIVFPTVLVLAATKDLSKIPPLRASSSSASNGSTSSLKVGLIACLVLLFVVQGLLLVLLLSVFTLKGECLKECQACCVRISETTIRVN